MEVTNAVWIYRDEENENADGNGFQSVMFTVKTLLTQVIEQN